ncbi:hypothetical protein [Hymenobacter arizonensis]|uniref:Uncharacterized protein n=1 Tax=Hymenobacter arizonensis TaxID=1227077 RepID=A0A1I6B935_HYMAR|nr:hypothetical protein [Hymenobacter arizonensis]SFQ77414.1 hypothetical protein SAMN04515668_4301 [Hymenobacter arizonensis]
MSAPVLLLRMASAWPLPGLGLLVLPAAPTPHLAAYELHTALAVEAVLPSGARCRGTATVEEITRTEVVERGLLLELEQGAPSLVPDTEIWLVDYSR